MTTAFTVRSTRADDWRELRGLRLEMLADTPLAFGETLQHAMGNSEDEWRLRAARGESDAGRLLAAIASDGAWIGTMGAFVPEGRDALLVGVYVSPACRGRSAGVTDALLDAIEQWTQPRFATLTLHVHEQNARARAAYEHRGFGYTGRRLPYVLDSAQFEVEMVKALR